MCLFLRIYLGTKSITAFPASRAFSDGLFYPKALVIWRVHIWCILTIWRLGLRINSVYGTRPLTWVDKTGRILAFTCNPTQLRIYSRSLPILALSGSVVGFCKTVILSCCSVPLFTVFNVSWTMRLDSGVCVKKISWLG